MSEDEKILDAEEQAREAGSQPQNTPDASETDTKRAENNGTEDASALEQAMKDQAREDEKPQSSNFTLRKILGGDWLTAELLRRQIGVILLITGFIIVYISNRYSCQKDMLEIDRLNSVLTDAKYKALSTASSLTEICRESNVMEMLRTHSDSGVLKVANQPPYIIQVPKNHRSATKQH